MKTQKKKLFSSLIVLTATFCMLLGSTFAWFTDTASNTGNKIQAGVLDVVLLHKEGTEYVDISASDAPVFDYNLWEPGYSTPASFKVGNNGNLALKYRLTFAVVDSKTGLENASADNLAHLTKVGANSHLEDVLEVYNATSLEECTAANLIGTLADFLDGTVEYEGELLAGETSDAIDLVILMPTSAGNEYENASISFDIRLVATQKTYEADGFGSDQYDASSVYPIINSASTAAITANVADDVTVTTSDDLLSVTIPADSVNEIFNSLATSTDPDVSYELTLTQNLIKNGEDTALSGSTATTTVDLDLTMAATMVTTTNAGSLVETVDVHDLGGYVTYEYNLGTGFENVVVKHNGNTMVDSLDVADDAGNGVYHYNSTTGVLTIKVDSLSPFTVSYVKEYEARIGETYYAKFSDAWTAAKNSGNEVVLLKDLTFNAQYAYGTYTLNLNGNTLTMRGHSAVSGAFGLDGGANYGHSNLTVKNGTLNLTGENYSKYGIYNYGTLTLQDLTINSACETVIYSVGQQWGTAGTTTLDNVTINATHSSGTAVAVYAYKSTWAGTVQPTLTITDSEIVGAYNAVAVYGANASVSDSVITATNNNALWISNSATASGVTGIITVSGDVTVNAGSDYRRINAQSGNSIVIEGGVYNFDPTNYLADGYVANDNGDGTWTVQ